MNIEVESESDESESNALISPQDGVRVSILMMVLTGPLPLSNMACRLVGPINACE